MGRKKARVERAVGFGLCFSAQDFKEDKPVVQVGAGAVRRNCAATPTPTSAADPTLSMRVAAEP